MSASAGAAQRRRENLKQSAVDMVLSMLVVIGIVVVVVALVPRPNAQPQRAVDVEGAAAQAAPRLTFVPAVPRGLPAGWVVTSADVRNSAHDVVTWHIGYITPDGRNASIEQAARVTTQWEGILDSGGTPQAAPVIDGTTWEQRYKDERKVTALIHRGGERTTMVTSKGSPANAEILARSIPASQR